MRTIGLSAAVLAMSACSGVASPTLPQGPAQIPSAERVSKLISPATPKDGIYVTQFDASSLYGYAGTNQRNAPPICGETSGFFVADVATDSKGDLVAPNQQGETVNVYRGPRLCGPSVAQLHDPYGLPVDAATADALTKKIVIANIEDDGPISDPPPGSITICTVAGGCTENLTNPQMNRLAGVALDKRGDCWASATNASSVATLIYFARCAGDGQVTTGFQNTGYGGLEFDKSGNLLAIDFNGTQIFVYSGCRPACSLVAGPFPLHGQSIYGKLDRAGTTFAAADYQTGRVDIYKYSSTALTYEYSFNQDLSQGSSVEGIAFSPGR
jgi:hypothetical protein